MDRYSMVVSIVGMVCSTAFLLSLVRVLVGRRNATPLPADVMRRLDTRLSEMQQSLDAVAVEVERISEGQRFTTKLLAERGISADDANAVRQPASGRPAR